MGLPPTPGGKRLGRAPGGRKGMGCLLGAVGQFGGFKWVWGFVVTSARGVGLCDGLGMLRYIHKGQLWGGFKWLGLLWWF
jgi:hypothetical protein